MSRGYETPLYPVPGPLRALDAPQLEALEASGSLRQYRRGDLIFSHGEPAHSVFCIRSGILKLIRSRPQGPRIIHLSLAGDMVGMASILADRPYSLSALALTAGEARLIDAKAFQKALRDSPPFSQAVLRQLALDLTAARDSLAMQGDLPVHARLARLLLELHFRASADPVPGAGALRLTRFDLAEILGSAQETVSRSLGSLEDAGLIRRIGRNILVEDASALKSVGDSDRASISRTLETLKSRPPHEAEPNLVTPC
jgi:CRP-like cAMP-binding protein